ncbi:MAG TPA: ABC transporter ATP-binding protein [Terriglobia bacterium]|nr:ABC transporter ATP-binding protein [Terriglobia bacterium]
MSAIEIKELTKDYAVGFWRKRPRRALHGLNLTVEPGETFGLLGPNGAGKSTTLKILFRLIFPTSGTARILGRNLNDRALHSRLGFLPENPSFYDHLSPEEFMSFAAGLLGLTRDERRRRSGELLDRTGLADAKSLRIRKLSKGMVQRLGIAQALINDPDVIFLDEPMSGLDPVGRREVRNLILDLRKEGKTVFFSTHILSDAETLCDRVAILNRGHLLGCGELQQILAMTVSATEMVLENPRQEILDKFRPYTRTVVRTGDRVRMEFENEHDSSTLLKMALACGARVYSFSPVKSSLEDFFMAQVGAQPPDSVTAVRDSEVKVRKVRAGG